MPKVELWLGNVKTTIDVPQEQMDGLIYVYPPPEPLCANLQEPFDHTAKVQVLCYKIDGWRYDSIARERVYKAVQVK